MGDFPFHTSATLQVGAPTFPSRSDDFALLHFDRPEKKSRKMDFPTLFSKNHWKVVKIFGFFFCLINPPEVGWAAPSRSSASISTMRLLNSSCKWFSWPWPRWWWKWRLVQWTASFNSAFRWYVSSSCSQLENDFFHHEKDTNFGHGKKNTTFFSKNASKPDLFSRHEDLNLTHQKNKGLAASDLFVRIGTM